VVSGEWLVASGAEILRLGPRVRLARTGLGAKCAVLAQDDNPLMFRFRMTMETPCSLRMTAGVAG